MTEWHRCTNVTDRWLTLVFSLLVVAMCFWTLQGESQNKVVIRDVHHEEISWPLNQDTVMQVDGRLGPVRVEVKNQQVRLVEYQSLRLVGTLTGWINKRGQITACVPCGVLIQIKGSGRESDSKEHYDGIAR